MTHRTLSRRLQRLEQRAAACGLAEVAPVAPSPEMLSALSTDDLVWSYRQQLRSSAFCPRGDEAEFERLCRLPAEELDRLYQEAFGLPLEEDGPEKQT